MSAGDRMTAGELAREILAGVAFTAHGPIWLEREGRPWLRLEDWLAFIGYGEPIMLEVIDHEHRFVCGDTPGTFGCSCGWTAHVVAENEHDHGRRGYCVHPTDGRPAFVIGDWDELKPAPSMAEIAEAVPELEEPALCSCGAGYVGHAGACGRCGRALVVTPAGDHRCAEHGAPLVHRGGGGSDG